MKNNNLFDTQPLEIFQLPEQEETQKTIGEVKPIVPRITPKRAELNAYPSWIRLTVYLFIGIMLLMFWLGIAVSIFIE